MLVASGNGFHESRKTALGTLTAACRPMNTGLIRLGLDMTSCHALVIFDQYSLSEHLVGTMR